MDYCTRRRVLCACQTSLRLHFPSCVCERLSKNESTNVYRPISIQAVQLVTLLLSLCCVLMGIRRRVLVQTKCLRSWLFYFSSRHYSLLSLCPFRCSDTSCSLRECQSIRSVLTPEWLLYWCVCICVSDFNFVFFSRELFLCFFWSLLMHVKSARMTATIA